MKAHYAGELKFSGDLSLDAGGKLYVREAEIEVWEVPGLAPDAYVVQGGRLYVGTARGLPARLDAKGALSLALLDALQATSGAREEPHADD